MKEINCKLRLVEERDIPILYQHLKEFLLESNSNVSGRPLPKFEDSEKFVLKYLHDNKNHEYDKWYVVLDDNQNIIGNVDIEKKKLDFLSYFKIISRKRLWPTSNKIIDGRKSP